MASPEKNARFDRLVIRLYPEVGLFDIQVADKGDGTAKQASIIVVFKVDEVEVQPLDGMALRILGAAPQENAFEALVNVEADRHPRHALSVLLLGKVDVGIEHYNLVFKRIVLLIDEP